MQSKSNSNQIKTLNLIAEHSIKVQPSKNSQLACRTTCVYLREISIAIDIKLCKHALCPHNSILSGEVVLSGVIYPYLMSPRGLYYLQKLSFL